MQSSPTIVFFFNDWKVYPNGVNAGGGEAATLSLAKAFARRGLRVICCAHLPEGECVSDGIEFWDFGASYNLLSIERRLRSLEAYYCFVATLVHPFIVLSEHANCLARIVINHSPSAWSSGLEPETVMNIVDRIVCVSQAQRLSITHSKTKPEKVLVVKNGFDPQLFSYQGPEGRDFRELLFVGRLEAAKGIHIAIEAYGILKKQFPDLKFTVCGDASSWSEMQEIISVLKVNEPNIHFLGKVPQQQVAALMRRAGLFLFPSISFESAGLGVIEAQASGCPTIAFGVGGVPEYMFTPHCGEILNDGAPQFLATTIARYLSDPEKLKQMSRNCLTHARVHSWDKVAEDLFALAGSLSQEKINPSNGLVALPELPEAAKRTIMWATVSNEQILLDHDEIQKGILLNLEQIANFQRQCPDLSAPYLWEGLLRENTGERTRAYSAYSSAVERSEHHNWQAHFRLAILNMEDGKFAEAKDAANIVLRLQPQFPYAEQLRTLIEKVTTAGLP